MEFYKRENNNFNLVRMIAAYAVIYAHSFAIQPNGNSDIITRISKVTHSGQLAVFIFVFLTGIYLCASLAKSKSLIEFIVKKIMRVFPMLILTLLVTIGIGAIFTALPLKEYLTNDLTREYFVKNLLNIENAHVLPGVFTNHNYSGMNGVLWYLTYILRVYLIGGILYYLNLFKTKEKANITLLVLLIWTLAAPQSLPLIGGNVNLYGTPDFPQYTVTIILASLIFVNYPNLRVKWYVPVMALLLCIVQKDYTYGNTIALWAFLAISTALWIGQLKILRKIKIIDCSFTIFLIGWPTSQVICELLPRISPILNTLLTIAITTIIGVIIHFTIDKLISKCTDKITTLIERSAKYEKK